MTTKTISDIKKTLEDTNIQHIQVKVHSFRTNSESPDKVEFTNINGNPIQVGFSLKGFQSLYYLTQSKKYPVELKGKFSYSSLGALYYDYLSALIVWQKSNEGRLHLAMQSQRIEERMRLVFDNCMSGVDTIYLHIAKNRVEGITRRWNPEITDDHILNGLAEHGFSTKIMSFWADDEKTNYRIRASNGTKDYGIIIRNGFSGRHSLSYSITARFAYGTAGHYYDFDCDLFGKNRHMSNVSVVFGKLEDAIKTVRQRNIIDRLEGMTSNKFMVLVREVFANRHQYKNKFLKRHDDEFQPKVFKQIGKTTDSSADKIIDIINHVASQVSHHRNGLDSAKSLAANIQASRCRSSGFVLFDTVMLEIFMQ